MSMFSPSSWMPHRTRVHSNNSADFSKDETLQGLKFSSPSPSQSPMVQSPKRCSPGKQLHVREEPLEWNANHEYVEPLHGSGLPEPITEGPLRYQSVQTMPINNRSNTSTPSRPSQLTHEHKKEPLQPHPSHMFRERVPNNQPPPPTEQSSKRTSVDVSDFSVEVFHQALNDIAEIPSIPRTGSNSGVSVISSLSKDDTYTGFDEDQHSDPQPPSPTNRNKKKKDGKVLPVVPRPKPCHVRAATVGKDFGSAFDHLVEQDFDKLERYLNDHHPEQRGPSSIPSVRTTNTNTTTNNTTTRRPSPSTSTSRNRSIARPKNLASHARCQSDTLAYRKSSPMYPHTLGGHFRSPTSIGSTSAHATLREKLTCTIDDAPPSLHLLTLKPQIAMSRSTSNTAQSTSGGTACSATSEVMGPEVVSAIQPTPTAGNRSYRHHSMGFGSNGSATVFSLQEESGEEDAGSFSKILVQNQHGGFLKGRIRLDTEDHNLEVEEEGGSSRAGEEKSIQSMDTRFTSGSRCSKGRRNVLKDEVKFIVGRMVPGPIKKVAQMVRRKPNLTRSDGCLT